MTGWLPIAGDGVDDAARDGRSLVLCGDVALGPRAPALDDELRRVLAGGFAVANLEAPLAGAGRPAPKAGPVIATGAHTPAWLAGAGFDAVGLANNHAMDHGWEGLRATIDACAAEGVRSFGAGPDEDAALAALHAEVGGRSVALLAVAEREFGLAGPADPGVAWVSHPGLERRIAGERKRHDLVVVCAHGGNEEVPLPSVQRRAQLRRLVDAGAQLVIGHHPHTPQGWERWGEGYVFHSLGDLCFDSGLPSAGGDGYLVRVSCDGPAAGLSVLPYRRDGARVRPDASPAAAARLRRLAEIAAGPELEAHWQEVALRLWDGRYGPALAAVMRSDDPYGLYLRLARLKARLRGQPHAVAADAELERDRALMLVGLLRCESHRWAMETAGELRSALRSDRRTPAIGRAVDELLRSSGFCA